MIPTVQKVFILFVCLLLTVSCKKDNQEETAATTSPPPPPQEIKLPYPALGNSYISKLYAETEKVDIIFYDLPISVNQEDAANAKSTVLYVSPTNPKVTADCKPIGRLTWFGNGEIVREADIYLDTGCAYLMFMENDEGVAVNALSQNGIDFFQKIISEVEKRSN